MYTTCSCMPHAQQVFDRMHRRDVVTWTCLILGYVDNGESTKALDLFMDMDCRPDSFSYVAVIKAYGSLAMNKPSEKENYLHQVVAIHRRLSAEGLESNMYIGSSLVDMYSKSGDMISARNVFEKRTQRDAVTWNCLILGYVENGDNLQALELFTRMDVKPDSVTFVGALKACSALASTQGAIKQVWLERGTDVHDKLRAQGYESNMAVGTTLIDMYSKCGSMSSARDVFEKMKDRNVVSWNSLILGYVENGEAPTAMSLFTGMDCEPDCVTFVAALKACIGLAEQVDRHLGLENGYSVHSQAKQRGYDSNIMVSSTLVYMYSKCGDMRSARDVFDKMTVRNLVVWTSLILGYVENGSSFVALQLFTGMDCQPDPGAFVAALKACIGLAESGEKDFGLRNGMILHRRIKERGFGSDTVVANTLLEMLCKYGEMQSAREVFDNMFQRNVVSWTCLISGYVEKGEHDTALEVFMSMDCEPNAVTLIAAFKACGNEARLPTGRLAHARACRLGLEQDGKVATSLVNFYGKCSDMTTTSQVFYAMHSPDIATWNALISGYGVLGEPGRVFRLITMVEEAGLQLTSVTFTGILTACSHAGMVEEAGNWFKRMLRCGITPGVEHYTCMVDMLGRSNRLEEAVEMIKAMPVEGDDVLWKSLLAASGKWSNLDVGRLAFDSLVKKNVKDPAGYVLLRDLYKRGD